MEDSPKDFELAQQTPNSEASAASEAPGAPALDAASARPAAPAPETVAAPVKKQPARAGKKIDLRRVKLPEARPRGEKESLVLRLVGSPMNLVMFVIATTPLVLVSDMLEWWGSGYVRLVIFVLYVFIVFAAVFRFAYKRIAFFTSLRKSLTEMMATLFFGCAVAALLISSNLIPRDEAPRAMLYAFGWSFLGATWAWHRMQLLETTAPRTRLLMLLKGWLLVPGGIGAAVLAFIIAAISIKGPSELSNQRMMNTFCISWAVSILAIPGVLVEIQVRKFCKNRRRYRPQAKETPATGASAASNAGAETDGKHT